VTFEYGTDLDQAVNQLTTAVNRIQPTLPQNVEPQIIAGSTDDIPAIVLAASGGADESDLLAKLNQTVVPELNAIEGVRDTQVTGARAKQVVITPDFAKLTAAGVKPAVDRTVLQANGVSCRPARSPTVTSRSPCRSGNPITSVDDLKGLYLTGGRGPVKLGDVAAVESKLPTATSYTRTDGVDSLGIRGHREAHRQPRCRSPRRSATSSTSCSRTPAPS
jgi:HAE1 family hydrophobic/amphiphilic exporter-1